MPLPLCPDSMRGRFLRGIDGIATAFKVRQDRRKSPHDCPRVVFAYSDGRIMKRSFYTALLEKDLPPKVFVENVLRILEFHVRELALICLDDWNRVEIPHSIWSKRVPELFHSIGSTPATLVGSLERAAAAIGVGSQEGHQGPGPDDRREAPGSQPSAIDPGMDGRPCRGRAGQAIQAAGDAPRDDAGQEADVALLAGSLHHPSESDRPLQAIGDVVVGQGLRRAARLVEGLAEQHDAQPIRRPTPLPAPWFVADGSTVLCFGGMNDDFTPMYLGLGAEPRHIPRMTQEIMVTFRQLLGAAEADEDNFRKLMARLLPEEQRGVQLGEYLVGKPVGEGGFARVHTGWQLSTGRKVAIKILRDGLPREYRERFQDEASYLARLDHPGIVGVLGQGVATWTPREHADLSKEEWFLDFKRSTIKEFIALEFLEGRSLEQMYADPAATPEVDELIEWFAQSAQALAEVHSLDDLVHRDIKPSNLIVSPEGQVKLLDFGIARSQVEARTMYTHLGKDAATPAYAAPEQLRQDRVDQVGPQSDIYGLSATFYEMFCKARLYDYDVVGVAEATNRKLNGVPPAPPRRDGRKIPWEVEVLLLDGLQSDPSLRPHSAKELGEDLRRVQLNEPIHHRRPPFTRRVALWSRRHKRPLQVSSAVGLIVILIATAIAGPLIMSERAKNKGLENAADVAKKGEAAEKRVKLALAYEKDMKDALDAWEGRRTGEVREYLKQYDPRYSTLEDDPRAFEWYYLMDKTASGVTNLKLQGLTRAVAFSPDGRRLGVAGCGLPDGNFVRLYRVDSAKLERHLEAQQAGNVQDEGGPVCRRRAARPGWRAGIGIQPRREARRRHLYRRSKSLERGDRRRGLLRGEGQGDRWVLGRLQPGRQVSPRWRLPALRVRVGDRIETAGLHLRRIRPGTRFQPSR